MKFSFRIVMSLILCIGISSCVEHKVLNSKAYQIIPKPQNLTPQKGIFKFTPKTQIILSEDSETLHFLGKYLSEKFQAAAGFELEQLVALEADKGNVFLHLDSSFPGKQEAYRLHISPERIIIEANHDSGLLYGVQSLRQLLPHAIESKEIQHDEVWEVPSVLIEDEPRFEYRGMQMDVSRHFFDVEELKEFIDRLAFFKFNKFHIHLTDDPGWRLQINQYPELTDHGAWRTMNMHDSICNERALTDSTFELPKKHFREKEGKQVYGGFYTQEQMKDVIAYASQRGITIVPEIDMPGHMKAAIDLYPDLSCVDGSGWGNKKFSIPLCPCEDGVYEFVENVLSEVVELFPGEYIHIGADEVDKSTWANSMQCKELMKREGLESVEELQSYFVKRMEKFLNGKGKKMIGWDEALEGGINPSTTIMYWRGWIPGVPLEAAEGGHKVIMTPTTHSYFDHKNSSKSTVKVYNFDPIPEALKGKHEDKIIGVQANLWSEYIPSMARLDYMSMPRMMSMAEVGWSQKEKDEADFMGRLDNIYPRLDIMDIGYRLPDLPDLPSYNTFVTTDTLRLEKPNIIDEIHYTTDGSIPDMTSTVYEGPIVVTEPTIFTIVPFHDGRKGHVSTAEFKQQEYINAEEVKSKPGIHLKYVKGNFRSTEEIENEEVLRTAVLETVKIPEFASDTDFGLLFEGYLEVPKTGVYSFYLRTDDGSTLEIGNKLVVDGNANKKASDEVYRQVALRKGKHPFKLNYFQKGGGATLDFQYHIKGEKDKKNNVPANMLSH